MVLDSEGFFPCIFMLPKQVIWVVSLQCPNPLWFSPQSPLALWTGVTLELLTQSALYPLTNTCLRIRFTNHEVKMLQGPHWVLGPLLGSVLTAGCAGRMRVRSAKLSSHPLQAGLPGTTSCPVWSLPLACTPCTAPVPISADPRALEDMRGEGRSQAQSWSCGVQSPVSQFGGKLWCSHIHISPV